MKCPKCNKEIENDSVFCEYCGEKIETTQPHVEPQENQKSLDYSSTSNVSAPPKKRKLKKWYIFVAAGVLSFVLILVIIHFVRYSSFSRMVIGSWPACQSDKYTFYVLQDGNEVKLVRLKSNFLCTYRTIQSYYDEPVEIRYCSGEHSEMGAFAALHSDGSVDFILNYNRGGWLSKDGSACLFIDSPGTTDENHLFGNADDYECGVPNHNVRNLFNQMRQPIKMSYDNKWHYISVDNTIDIGYDDAYPFCYGLARVYNDGRWFYIRPDGSELQIAEGFKIVTANDFIFNEDFGKEVAYVELYANGKSVVAWIDYNGNFVTKEETVTEVAATEVVED